MPTRLLSGTPNNLDQESVVESDGDSELNAWDVAVYARTGGTIKLSSAPVANREHLLVGSGGAIAVDGNGKTVVGPAVVAHGFSIRYSFSLDRDAWIAECCGEQGPSGPSGPSGASGASGASGPPGASGAPGTTIEHEGAQLEDDTLIPDSATFTSLLTLPIVVGAGGRDVSIRGYIGGTFGDDTLATVTGRLVLTPTAPPGAPVILSGAGISLPATGSNRLASMPVLYEAALTAGSYDVSLECQSIGDTFLVNPASDPSHQGASLAVDLYS